MRILRLLLLVVLVGVTGLLLARFVVRGPVDERSLAQAIVRETGSADRLLGATQPCRRTGRTGIFRCVASDGSGGADYRVRIRTGSSCFDGRRLRDDSEERMPRRVSGCVYLWQWSLVDLI